MVVVAVWMMVVGIQSVVYAMVMWRMMIKVVWKIYKDDDGDGSGVDNADDDSGDCDSNRGDENVALFERHFEEGYNLFVDARLRQLAPIASTHFPLKFLWQAYFHRSHLRLL